MNKIIVKRLKKNSNQLQKQLEIHVKNYSKRV